MSDVTDRLWIPPVRLPPPGQMTAWHKGRLVAEILGQYVPLLRSLRRTTLAIVLADARHAGCVRLETVPADEPDLAVRLGSIVEHVMRPLPTDTRCLIRSLVLLRLLARRGIEAELVIGVRDPEEFAAHAWVEHRAVALLPAGDFQPLMRL